MKEKLLNQIGIGILKVNYNNPSIVCNVMFNDTKSLCKNINKKQRGFWWELKLYFNSNKPDQFNSFSLCVRKV